MSEFEPHERCGVITINRPQAGNAVNADVAPGIEESIDRLEEKDVLWQARDATGRRVGLRSYCLGAG